MSDLDLPFVSFDRRALLPAISCIYFAVSDEDEILYVGQSINVRKRWSGRGHHNSHQMRPSYRIYWMPVPFEDLNRIENAFIMQLDPPWNKDRGGARAAAGSPPNLDRTINLLRRQIDWYEAAKEDRRPVDFALAATRLNIQVNRLLSLAGIDRPPTLTQAERDASHAWAVQAVEDEGT